jgi:hypothetical protein
MLSTRKKPLPEGKYTVNAISAAGEPIEPPKIAAKFHNAIGAIIRTKIVLDPTITNWTLVPASNDDRKDEIVKSRMAVNYFRHWSIMMGHYLF